MKRPYQSASINASAITVIMGLAAVFGVENITPETAGAILIVIGAVQAWLRVRTSGQKISLRR